MSGAMRLTDLDPNWIGPQRWSATEPFYVGVSFVCPCEKCRAPACITCGHAPDAKRLAVNFYPPIDPKSAAAKYGFDWPDTGVHRRVSGDTFGNLTLAPSVGFEEIGHWHGHITNGDVT